MNRCRTGLALGIAAYLTLLSATVGAMRRPAALDLRAATSAAGTTVAWVLPASAAWDAGVRVGDQLPTGPPARGAHTVTVQRAQGGSLLLDPAQRRLPGPSAAGMLIVGGLILLMAGSALARTGCATRARWLMAPFLVAGPGLLVAPATAASQGWALALTFVGLLVLGPTFLAACRYFAAPRGRARHAAAAACFVVLALAVLALALYARAVVTGGTDYPLAQSFNEACLACSVVASVPLVLRWAPRLRGTQAQSAPLFVLLGLTAGLVPFAALFIAPSLLNLARVPPQIISSCLLVFPAVYVYAVRRHRLLGLPSVWDRHLTRASGAIVLAALYLFLFGILTRRITGDETLTPVLPLGLLVVFALGLSVQPVARAAAYAADRVLFHDAYSHHRALRQLIDTVADATDVRAASVHALGNVRTWLDLTWLALLARQAEDWRILAQDTVRSVDGPTRLPTALWDNSRAGWQFAGRTSSHAAFPVDVHVGEEVVLLAGPKANGEALRRADRDVLVALATMLGAPLARARLLVEAQERVAELERQQAALQALGQRLMVAQETERRRLAVELHDGPLQRLHYLLRLFDGEAPASACRAVAAHVAGELRATALTLRPPALDDELGLPGALAALARQTEPGAGCPITVETEGYARGRLAAEAERALYRIAREALNNCVRHSGASNIALALRLDGQGAALEVRDDGMGFDADEGACTHAPDGRQRLGLLEMRESAEAWAGTLIVASAPGRGTLVKAMLPLGAGNESTA